MTERSQDARPELVLKAGGELRVHFKEANDANVFISSCKIPLIEMTRDADDENFIHIHFSADVVKANMTYATKKLEDIFRELYKSSFELKAFGSIILIGDSGFIIKYEPADGPAAFKFASVNGFLKLDVDTLNELLQKYVYSCRENKIF